MMARTLAHLLLLIVCGAVNARARDAAPVRDSARTWRAEHERDILAEFAELVAIPNLASDRPNIERNVAAIRAMCERRGLTIRVLELPDAPPLIVADLAVPEAKKTIAFYAHYDGQPADPKQWKSPPWTPVMRDAAGTAIDWRAAKSIDPEWRLYARSAGDDKAPIMAMLSALDALRAAKVPPASNLRLVFEGEEERGSPHLAVYLQKYADALRADAWILCDSPVHQSRRMLLAFGARGVVDLELTVYGPVKALHDGHYGNWVPNPAAELARLIASMRDESGRILIDGFYDNVRPPTDAERAALREIPDVETELRREFQIGATEGNGKPLNELLLLPALNVRGLEAGHVGDQAANAIPTEARASIDFRLVPDQTPESIQPLVEKHFAREGYTVVRGPLGATARAAHPKLLRVDWGSGDLPARTPLDLPLSREVEAIMKATGHDPVLLPTMGGSIPMKLFQGADKKPAILLPIANHDDNQHAADENVRLQNLWDGVEIFAALFATLGAQ